MDNDQAKNQKIVKFSDIKQELVAELNKKMSQGKISFQEKVNIVDGFLNSPITMKLSNSFIIGGLSIPTIMLIGEESGQIYFFAVKMLIPHKFE